MEELFYNDYSDFVEMLLESYEDINDRIYDNNGVVVIANAEDTRTILAELLLYGYDVSEIVINKKNDEHEYLIEIHEDTVSCVSAWHDSYKVGNKTYKSGYKFFCAEEFYLMGDVNSSILNKLDGKTYMVEITQDEDDETYDCCGCENVECESHPCYNPHSSISVKVNGKEIEDENERMEYVMDIISEMSLWRDLLD